MIGKITKGVTTISVIASLAIANAVLMGILREPLCNPQTVYFRHEHFEA